MPRTPLLRLRRAAAASLALSLLVPLGAACGSGDPQGQRPAPTTTPGTARNEYTPGGNNDTGQSKSGQPQSGTDDSGGGNNSNTVNGN